MSSDGAQTSTVIEPTGRGTIEDMKAVTIAAVCLSLAVLPFAACDDTTSCTLEGCGTTLEVLIEVEGGGPLPDSSYEIVLELDGMPYTTACGRPEPSMFICEPVEGPDEFVVEASTFTDGSAIALRVTADEGEGDGPELVHVLVVAADAPLVDTTVEPTYTSTFPNGEECGSPCVQAEPITTTFARP